MKKFGKETQSSEANKVFIKREDTFRKNGQAREEGAETRKAEETLLTNLLFLLLAAQSPGLGGLHVRRS